MKHKENYYIGVYGQAVKVTPEVYAEYYRRERKERYFMHDLKVGRQCGDSYFSSREVSYEKLCERGLEITGSQSESLEEQVIDKLIKKELRQAVGRLDEGEQYIIYSLFYLGKTERELSKNLGIPQPTLHYKKKKILDKLKKFMHL